MAYNPGYDVLLGIWPMPNRSVQNHGKTLTLRSCWGPTKNGIQSGIRRSFGHLADAEQKCAESQKNLDSSFLLGTK